MDGIFLAAGFFSRFKKSQGSGAWEDQVEHQIISLTEDEPTDVTIIIPALQIELGSRLELTSKLMKEKGYRLRQVIPESGMTWKASFIRLDD